MARAAALTCTLLVIGGPGASVAEAHFLKQGKHETTAHWADRLAHHGHTGTRWIRQNASRYPTYRQYRRALRNHQWLLRFGERLQARSQPAAPPHYREWMCIHSYEGAWDDPNPPYYGGLQMDWGFMRNYGSWLLARKGTADHWSPTEQMWVAERGLRVQGWGAWPNTARMCGLL